MLPFQVAFFGMCLLVILQSAFAIVLGVVLYRLARALGAQSLFPALGRRALPEPDQTAIEEERLKLAGRVS